MADTRVVLVKPGDVLIFGNIGDSVDVEEAADAARSLKDHLRLAAIWFFNEDIDLAVVDGKGA